MAVDHSKCWEQTPALSSTPKVPNVTVTMSEEAHSYACHEGASPEPPGKERAGEWGCMGTRGGTLAKIGPRASTFSRIMNIPVFSKTIKSFQKMSPF